MLKDNSSLIDLSSIKNSITHGVTTVDILTKMFSKSGSLATVRAVSMQDLNFENPSDIFNDFGCLKSLIMLNLRGLTITST